MMTLSDLKKKQQDLEVLIRVGKSKLLSLKQREDVLFVSLKEKGFTSVSDAVDHVKKEKDSVKNKIDKVMPHVDAVLKRAKELELL